METAYHCYNCDNYGSKECEEKGYVHEMNDHIPACFELENGIKICLLCGSEIENDEEILWGHIQMEHEEKFEEVQDWDTPDMLDECYKSTEDTNFEEEDEEE